MRIAVLSRDTNLYSSRRFKEACQRRGHKIRTLDPLAFWVQVEAGHPELMYRGRRLSHYDAVIPRIGASFTLYGTAVVRQFEQMGVFCLNSSQGISYARDKLRAIQLLSRHALGIPHTAFVKRREDVMPAIEAVGGAPVVIKLLEGTQGVGVILAESTSMAQAIIDTLHSTRQNVLIQKFVKESKGSDIRAIVIGNRVLAAMRRRARAGEFRSNVHQGGAVEPVKLSPDQERTAIQAAQIIGLNFCGVDMLESSEGPQVMEVNSSPGLEGIESATGVDVAGAVVEYLEQHVLLPEIDIRQRLTLQHGYGVAEILVDKKSPFREKTVGETGLRDLDINVLSILREGVALPNPRGDRRIHLGDTLICFGRLDVMKDYLQRRKRPRKKKVAKIA